MKDRMRERASLLLPILLLLGSCDALETFNDPCAASDRIVGETAVALDVQKATVRSRQAPVGDLVADAVLAASVGEGAVAAIQNAGSIRPEICRGGERVEIPAGPITEADVEDLLPFENVVTIVNLSGPELKSVLERSVSALPEANEGWFVQVAGLSFDADCTRQRQVLSNDGTSVVTEGDRVTSITVGGALWSSAGTYTIATNDYVAAGEDGFLAMRDGSVRSTAILFTDALQSHLALASPVAPTGTGRITLTGCQ